MLTKDCIKPVCSNTRVELYWEDAWSFLSYFRFSEGDVIVTDPPYGTGSWRLTDGSREIRQEQWDVCDFSWLKLCDRRQ